MIRVSRYMAKSWVVSLALLGVLFAAGTWFAMAFTLWFIAGMWLFLYVLAPSFSAGAPAGVEAPAGITPRLSADPPPTSGATTTQPGKATP